MQALQRAAFAALLAATSLFSHGASAAESYDNCTGFIESLPASLNTQGTWCLRKDVATSLSSGSAITINAPNVTIDCNGFKIGGLGAGPNSRTTGILSVNRNNVTVRNCAVRGFFIGLDLTGAATVVENNRVEASTFVGIAVESDAGIVRNNLVTATGGTDFIWYDNINAMGIYSFLDVDIVDNVIAGVVSKSGTNGLAIGIDSGKNLAGSIIGNNVRGLVADGTGWVDGLSLWGALGRTTVADNRFVGTGAGRSIGVRCGNDGDPNDIVVLNNVMNGFQYPVTNCAQFVGNQVRELPLSP